MLQVELGQRLPAPGFSEGLDSSFKWKKLRGAGHLGQGA